MFIHILNLTHQHLNVAVASEVAILTYGLKILPLLSSGIETEIGELKKEAKLTLLARYMCVLWE